MIFMTSRLILAIQYGTIIWHVRAYRHTRLPLGIMVGMHSVAAVIYLGVAFSFHGGWQRGYIAWYVVAIAELAISITLSLFWDVLTFKGTHLNSRMALLTLIIIGEGIIVICTNITTIVKSPDAWSTFSYHFYKLYSSLSPRTFDESACLAGKSRSTSPPEGLTDISSASNDRSCHVGHRDHLHYLPDLLRLEAAYPLATDPAASLVCSALPLPPFLDALRGGLSPICHLVEDPRGATGFPQQCWRPYQRGS